MRTLVFLSTLALTACTSNNPFFSLETDATTSSSTSTTVDPPTTTDPTAPGTTTDPLTTDPLTTAGPTTESPTAPVTSSSSDPGTTAIAPDTTTGVVESSSSGSSTGAEFCALGNPEFSGYLYQGNAPDPAELCPLAGFNYFPNTKLLKGDGPLRIANCQNQGEPLSIGKGYDLPLLADSPCGKLYLFRDGDGPVCDIGYFYFIAEQKPYAAGSFSAQQPPPNPPAALVTLVEEVPWEPCCPVEAQDCCPEGLGDYSLVFSEIPDPIIPGELVEEIPGQDNTLFSVINIQAWISATCDPIVYAHASDWAAVRTK